MRRILFVFALILFICVSSFGLAFDNHRGGFIIGGLGGVAWMAWTQSIDNAWGDRVTNSALHTDFRIGGGTKDDIFMLYYWNAVNWFRMENVLGDEITMISGLTGVGWSLYFKPTSPAWYFHMGFGVSVWTAPFEPDAEAWYGWGLKMGVGYEFARHWSIECSLMRGNPMTTESGMDFQTDIFAIALSIIGIAY